MKKRFMGGVGSVVGDEQIGFFEHGPLVDVIGDAHVRAYEVAAASR